MKRNHPQSLQHIDYIPLRPFMAERKQAATGVPELGERILTWTCGTIGDAVRQTRDFRHKLDNRRERNAQILADFVQLPAEVQAEQLAPTIGDHIVDGAADGLRAVSVGAYNFLFTLPSERQSPGSQQSSE